MHLTINSNLKTLSGLNIAEKQGLETVFMSMSAGVEATIYSFTFTEKVSSLFLSAV